MKKVLKLIPALVLLTIVLSSCDKLSLIPSDEVEFLGIKFKAIGDAKLLIKDGALKIKKLGTSGTDGIRESNPGEEYGYSFEANIDDNNGELISQQTAIVDGKETLWSESRIKNNGGQLEYYYVFQAGEVDSINIIARDQNGEILYEIENAAYTPGEPVFTSSCSGLQSYSLGNYTYYPNGSMQSCNSCGCGCPCEIRNNSAPSFSPDVHYVEIMPKVSTELNYSRMDHVDHKFNNVSDVRLTGIRK